MVPVPESTSRGYTNGARSYSTGRCGGSLACCGLLVLPPVSAVRVPCEPGTVCEYVTLPQLASLYALQRRIVFQTPPSTFFPWHTAYHLIDRANI